MVIIISFSYAVYKHIKLLILQYKYKKYPTLLIGQYAYSESIYCAIFYNSEFKGYYLLV